jgi:2-succinyl-6-hydroxy-2,4-cyclohexadiene-1-carboxylate synthase
VRDLVLLHGFTQTQATWRPVAAGVAERYRLRTPDIRGHGTSSGVRPVTFDAVIDDVAGLADGAFMLGGYSMGGRLALLTALAHPERIERLVVISASPGIADDAEREARRRGDDELAGTIERVTLEDFAETWSLQPLFDDQPPEVRAAAHEDRLRNTPEGLAAALRGLGTGVMPSLWERLPELAMPVALVVGEHDEKFLALNQAMAERIRGAELHVIPGAGHAVHLERPAEVAAVIATPPDRLV